MNIEFLTELDYIGINAWPYFRKFDVVSVGNIRKAWREAIFFTETFGVTFDYEGNFFGDNFTRHFAGARARIRF